MEIDELRKKRIILERDISYKVSALVEKFKEETGFSPCGIAINIVSEKKIGDHEPQYFVGKTNVDIKL